MIDAKQAGERAAKVIHEQTYGKSEKELASVEEMIEKAIKSGYRSITIDASHLNVISQEKLKMLGYTLEYYGGWHDMEPEYTIKF